MQVVDFRTNLSTVRRPMVVAAAHVSIILIILLACPLWILLPFRPAALERLALRILVELRRWSADIIAGGQKEGK